MLLKKNSFKMKIFQFRVIEGRLTVETCFSNETAGYSSLDESCIVFGVNCKFAHEKYVKRHP